MKLYIYRLTLMPAYHDFAAWDAKVQEAFKLHAAFLEKNIHDGRVFLVGRTDAELRDNYGLVLFEAENQEDADAFARTDPAVSHGVMSVQALPFKLLKVTEQARKWNAW